MNDLEKYFYNNPGRRIHKWTHYFDIYDRHFSKFRGKEVHILEFGVAQGGSLQMWKEYFGPKAKIYGVDINYACKNLEEENVKIYIGSQEDEVFLTKLKKEIPHVDILIDDGGHTTLQQRTTFKVLYDHVAENGVYLCEDTNTSYKEKMGGGFRKKSSFIEFTKNYIDELYGWHGNMSKQLSLTNFTKTTDSISYYHNVVAIEKRSVSRPENIVTGKRSFGIEKQQVDAIIQEYKANIHKDPKNVKHYKTLGEMLVKQKMPIDAIPILKQAIDLNPIDPAMWFALGNAYLMNGKGELAIESHTQALELNEKYPFYIYTPYSLIAIARIHKNKKRIKKAIGAYDRAIKIEHSNPNLYHEFGLLKITNDLIEEGIVLLNKALELDPQHKASLEDLASVYQKIGDEIKVDQLLEKIKVLEEVA